jgi:hypothetical protein
MCLKKITNFLILLSYGHFHKSYGLMLKMRLNDVTFANGVN